MRLELMIMTPDNQTRRMPLDGELISLGRAHSNDLCYPDDASLSRRHLQFVAGESSWTVEDLGSKNGTLRNGVRLSGPQPLRPGDRLSAGHLIITVLDPEGSTDQSVVFVPEEGPAPPPNATIMTSLEGLISGEATSPGRRQAAAGVPGLPTGAEPGPRFEAFNSPVVQALVRAGRELSSHRPLSELFQLILDLSIETVGAERGVLMTLEGAQLVPRAVHGDGFRISTTVRDRVLKEKTSLLVRDLQAEEDLRLQHSISEQQIQTMMAVPLQTEDRVIGLVYVDSRSFIHQFTEDDLNLLTVLANVAAIRIEHERFVELQAQEQRRTADLMQAAEIQRGILPRGRPKNERIDLAGYNSPCRTVGGDYYDFIDYPDHKVAVVLGDVAGKGMSAAMLMSNLQARVQILAEDPSDLADLVGRLDQAISINSPPNRFITFFIGLIDPEARQMRFCNAGHNPPLLVRSDGSLERLTAMGTVLGILPELGYEEKSVPYGPGDVIAVFSDGVTEAENGQAEEFGEERLAQLLIDHRDRSSAEQIIEAVIREMEAWTSAAPAEDDITLLVARYPG